jgi:uncharacterized protein (TIGR02466 family)
MTDWSSRDLDAAVAGAQVLHFFSSPVCKFLWPDGEALNRELKQVILRRMRESPGVVKTNRGGWQSKADLHTWPDACVQTFVARSHALVRELVRRTVPGATPAHLSGWEMVAWANVNQKGAFNTAHDHHGYGTIWSSFYYVDPGGSEGKSVISGFTKFQDRSGTPKEIVHNPDPFEREVTITPQSGLMVLFPSTLYHYVEPYQGDRERITIAFNMKHPGFTIPVYPGMEEEGWWWKNFRGIMVLPAKAQEKLYALSIVPGEFFARGLPRTLRPGAWGVHLKAALEHATAKASARTDAKRASPR